MRDRTQGRIETLAAEQRAETIDLELVEAGIALGKEMMEELVRSYDADKAAKALEESAPQAAPGGEAQASGSEQAGSGGGKCPFAGLAEGTGTDDLKKAAELYLNEVGLMSEMAKKRREDAES